MSVQTQIDRLNAIKTRIRTNLVAQGITVPADTTLEAMAEQILSVAGDDGQRGTGLLPVTTAPSSYTTAVGGITPKYRMAISTIKTQAGVTEVLLGDTIRYSYYHYPVAYLDSSYAYFTTRVSIRGAAGTNGTTPVKGTDYWTETDQESIVQQVITALGTPVFGRVDADNNIILTGELADGTYTLKYEDGDGKLTVVGTIAKEPPVEFGWVYGQPGRDGDTQIVFYSDPAGQTNYKMIYQTTGNVPLYTSAALSTATNYYPLVVPEGKTKMKITFPNLGSNKFVMAVRAMTLDGNAYKQSASSGWLTEGVYEWSFDSGTKYLVPYFRNNTYGGLNTYDTSGVTVTWE